MSWFKSFIGFFSGLWGWFVVLGVIGAGAFLVMNEGGGADEAQMLPAPQTPYAAVVPGFVGVEGGVIEIAARSGGTFREVFVEAGDRVEAGQLLAEQFDDAERIQLRDSEADLETARLNLQRARNSLATNERNLERARIQFEADALSEQAFDTASDSLAAAQIELRSREIALMKAETGLETARTELELRKIRAPVDGRIAEVLVRPGAGASTTQVSAAFVMVPDAPRTVTVSITEETLQSVFVGQAVQIAPSLNPSERYPGEVRRIAEIFVVEDGGGGSGRLPVEIVAEDLPLRIGQPVTVRFLKPENADG
ncbi:MAG: HlyD family efflux transporter periplasmic adaptor subunit [Pseudomonadota bacterium]